MTFRVMICGGRRYPEERRHVVEKLCDLMLEAASLPHPETGVVDDRLQILHTGANGAAKMAASWAELQATKGRNVTSKAFRVEKPLAATIDQVVGVAAHRVRQVFLIGKPSVVYQFPSFDNEVRRDDDIVEEAERRKIPVQRITWQQGLKRQPWCHFKGLCTACEQPIRHKGEVTAERPADCGACGHKDEKVKKAARICDGQCASCKVLDKEPTP